MRNTIRILALASALTPLLAGADGAAALFDDAKLDLDLRYRIEQVDQAGFADDALASTLRARLGVTSGTVEGFSMNLTFEATTTVGPDDYDSTANGKTQFPKIADPADQEVDQAFVQWQGGGWQLRYGRQRLVLDNQRFVGNVGFRQNEQTFDAFGATGTLLGGTLSVALLENANRVFGDHNPTAALADTPLEGGYADYGRQLGPGKLSVYAHYFEFEQSPASSHRNLGLRYAGEPALGPGKLRFALEYAQQDPWKQGAATIDQDYQLLEAGFAFERFGFRVAEEVLGGDGTRGFQTPFATLHAFNGWADRFLTTPADGLVDRYLKLDGKQGKLAGYLAFHDFEADATGAAYGQEVDLGLTWAHDAHTTFKFEYADYASDGFATDTRILWLTAEFKH